MKKFLLVAFAVLFVGSANAQLAKKQTVGKPKANAQMRTNHVLPQATTKKYEMLPAKQIKPIADLTAKKLQVTPDLKKSLKLIERPINKAARAATIQEMYEATGVNSDKKAQSWEMYSGTGTYNDGTTVNVLQNLTPDPFDFFEDGIVVEYTLQGNNIIIEPQLLLSATFNEPIGQAYIVMENASATDRNITLTLDNNGNITGSYNISFNLYSSPDHSPASALGYYYERYTNVKYNLPGIAVAPEVSFEPDNLVLFAGLGVSGAHFVNNLSITSAYAPISFRNLTTDKATEWQWSAIHESADDEAETLTGNEKDYIINTVGLDTYSDIKLIGVNQTATSNPFTFGWGKTDAFVNPQYPDAQFVLYGGGSEYMFEFSNGTYPVMTRQDPDLDLMYYTNWGTPDLYEDSMSKIYCYHEKPATPLYIEGITLPVVAKSFNENFNLHIKIYEATYTGTRPTLGRVLAEGDATIANVDDTYAAQSGLTAINFDDLYVEDEIGMSESLPFLHIDTEFVVVIEGWDNGTFSAVLGNQEAEVNNARTSTWFEMTGEAGSMYSYGSWPTLFVGLIGATYGWMHTEDNTDVAISAEGGEATIHIADAFYPAEYTWVESEYETESGLPEWLEVLYTPGDNDFTWDFVFKAEALPAGTTSREAEFELVQWGAKLAVKVVQSGTGTGITTVTKVTENGKAYNLSGRQVKAGQKGLMIRDGKKFIVK